MRVLMLPDADFLRRERAMLDRLEIGMADEGARVLHATPVSSLVAGGGVGETPVVYSTALAWHDRGLPFTLGLRATALVRAMESVAPVDGSVPGERLVDIVHGVGEGAWPMGLAVARRTGAVAALEVWSAAAAERARAVWRKHGITGGDAARAGERGGPGAQGRAPFFLAAGEALAALLSPVVPAERVAVVPFGVHPGDAERKPMPGPRAGAGAGSGSPGARALSLVVLASGEDQGAVREALGAVELIGAQVESVIAFLDAGVAQACRLGGGAAQVGAGGLAERVSLVPDLEAHRDLILQADVLILPEARGEHRTLVLDAMAAGCLVVARPDTRVEHLIDGRTAAVARGAGAAGLAEVVLGLAAEPARAEALRQSAWAYIGSERSASRQVMGLRAAFDRALGTGGA
jgi:hypothetical protein